MEGYLGEFPVDIMSTTMFNWTEKDWALHWIDQFGWVDGAHHKDWVLDQVARILNGTEVIVKQARWENGQTEFRIDLGEPSEAYVKWRTEITDGNYENYEEGCPP